MASPLSEFGQTAQRLARNPLGIIALFIVLVYGIAGLVLGYSAANLQPNEKLPLIWFLVLFPVVVLAAFLWLVTRHHMKLYAPHDFPDKEGFFRALTPAEQKSRLDTEVAAIQAETAVAAPHGTQAADRLDVAEAMAIRHEYVLAEELAFREIEEEFGVPVLRNVAMGAVGFDGILTVKGKPTAIEIKFTRRRNWRMMMNETVVRLDHALERYGSMPVLLAIVIDGLTSEQRESATSQASDLLKKISRPATLRIYDFGELKEKYGFTTRGT